VCLGPWVCWSLGGGEFFSSSPMYFPFLLKEMITQISCVFEKKKKAEEQYISVVLEVQCCSKCDFLDGVHNRELE